MTLSQFKILKKGRKIETVCRDGVRLLEGVDGNYMITLYQIEYFYVEVYFDCKLMQITKLQAYSSTLLLEPFLKQIDISFLLQDSQKDSP